MYSRNNRYLSNRSRNNPQSLLNRHFENIALLGRLIENSQRLLESNRQLYSNRFSVENNSDNLSEQFISKYVKFRIK